VPLHTPTVLAPRLPRPTRAAAALATCATAAAATIAIAYNQPASQVRASTEPSPPVALRYFDIEANKANSMKALARHNAEQRASRASRLFDTRSLSR
jgi:curli biogenesis system outer membrane secretion channel CsgG